MSAGVASARWSGFVSHPSVVASSGNAVAVDSSLLAEGVAPELETMGIVDDAVEDGVGEGGIADHIVPAVDWELTGDQGSAAAGSFFGDLEQVMSLFGTEGFEAPVVESR